MRRGIVVGVLLAISLAMYVVGIVMMVTDPQANGIPTPAPVAIGGVLAMFATVGVFAAGFVWLATEPG